MTIFIIFDKLLNYIYIFLIYVSNIKIVKLIINDKHIHILLDTRLIKQSNKSKFESINIDDRNLNLYRIRI